MSCQLLVYWRYLIGQMVLSKVDWIQHWFTHNDTNEIILLSTKTEEIQETISASSVAQPKQPQPPKPNSLQSLQANSTCRRPVFQSFLNFWCKHNFAIVSDVLI